MEIPGGAEETGTKKIDSKFMSEAKGWNNFQTT